MSFPLKIILGLAAVIGVGLLLTFQYPPVEQVQRGYRGVALVENYHPATMRSLAAANQLPDAIPAIPESGQPSSAVYQNVQVLKDVDSSEFLRIMAAITAWVAPQQGCGYCHETEDMASDKLYTKVVARRMLQMVQHINGDWKQHVQGVGVTCWTCHRGQPVPSKIWFLNPGPPQASGFAETHVGKNVPAPVANYSSLPYDPFTPFLEGDDNIRVESTQALPGTDRQSIKQTDWTYSLMLHFSESLGVNCTYCHNSRQFSDWSQSAPQRVTAWYGIRMVRDLNNNYLNPLTAAHVFPANRLGPTGDGPKLNCATCHQGVYKPLFGVSMIGDYKELTGPTTH